MRTWRNSILVVAAVSALTLAACGGDDGEASLDEFCDLARQADSAGDDLSAAFESGDADEVQRVFDEALDDFRAAADAAPDEVQDIAAEVTETAEDLRDRFEELDWDPAVALEDETALEIAARGETANVDLDEFLERECDIPADSGTDDGDATDVTDVPSTEPAASVPEGSDASTIAGLLGAAIAEELGIDLDDEARACIGDTLVDGLGVDQILEAGASGQGVNAFDEEQQAVIIGAVEECIPTEQLAESLVASGTLPDEVTDEQAQCLFEAALEEIGFAAMASAGEPTPEQEEALRAIAEDCGIDPDLLDA